MNIDEELLHSYIEICFKTVHAQHVTAYANGPTIHDDFMAMRYLVNWLIKQNIEFQIKATYGDEMLIMIPDDNAIVLMRMAFEAVSDPSVYDIEQS